MASTYSIEPAPKQDNDPATNAQLIFVLRTFENVSSVFGPNWHRMATRTGKYRPFDMNMPFTIPALKFSTCETDPPLTVFGKFCAQTVARSLRNQLFKMSFIVCAPSLRCVQTACTFAEVMEAKVYVLEELAEPEIILKYGSQRTTFGKYLSIDQLRQCGYNVQGLRLKERRQPHVQESDLRIMLRIGRALRELTTEAPKGPALIVGDALVLKIANSISTLPDDYTDPLNAKPFCVPSLELSEEKEAVKIGRYDFTQLDEYYPTGTMNVYLRQKDDDGNDSVVRIPCSTPKITVYPDNGEKEKGCDLKATNPENAVSIQQNGPAADNSCNEISIN